VPDTAVVRTLGVRLVVVPLVIGGLPNALANGLASESVALSTSVATKEIDAALTAKLEIVGASLTAVILTVVVCVALLSVPSLTCHEIVRLRSAPELVGFWLVDE
jgi:hypothetical protein